MRKLIIVLLVCLFIWGGCAPIIIGGSITETHYWCDRCGQEGYCYTIEISGEGIMGDYGDSIIYGMKTIYLCPRCYRQFELFMEHTYEMIIDTDTIGGYKGE